jgi:hypothetical protein
VGEKGGCEERQGEVNRESVLRRRRKPIEDVRKRKLQYAISV